MPVKTWKDIIHDAEEAGGGAALAGPLGRHMSHNAPAVAKTCCQQSLSRRCCGGAARKPWLQQDKLYPFGI